jgi:DNA-binding NarL/FixJ family response regulator
MIKTINQYSDFFRQNKISNTLFIGNNKFIYAGLKQILGNISEDIVLSYSEDIDKLKIINKLELFDVIIFENITENHLNHISKICKLQEDIKIIALIESDFKNQYLQIDLKINVNDTERIIHQNLENFYSNFSNIKNIKDIIKGENDISLLFKKLSNREFEIARLMIKGYGNLEITNELNLKASTVSTFKSRIFQKLNIINVIQLANKFDEYQYNKCV